MNGPERAMRFPELTVAHNGPITESGETRLFNVKGQDNIDIFVSIPWIEGDDAQMLFTAVAHKGDDSALLMGLTTPSPFENHAKIKVVKQRIPLEEADAVTFSYKVKGKSPHFSTKIAFQTRGVK